MSIIKISRAATTYPTRHAALEALKNECYHRVGQPVMVKYGDLNTPDVILAIGVWDGYGEEKFKVISLGGLVVVTDVTEIIPDVTSLAHGELYIYHCTDPITLGPNDELIPWAQDGDTVCKVGKSYYVYLRGEFREIEEIPSITDDFQVVSSTTKYTWFWKKGGSILREDDFASASDTAALVQEMLYFMDGEYNIKALVDQDIFEYGETVDIPVTVKVVKEPDEDITQECKIFLDNIEKESNRFTIRGVNQPRDYVITVARTIAGVEFKKSVVLPIRFGRKIYWGKGEFDLETANSKVWIKKDFKLEGIELDEEICYFAYPKIWGKLTHIFDVSGLEYIYDYYIQVIPSEEMPPQLDNKALDYYLYIKLDAVIIAPFLQHYIFDIHRSVEDPEGLKEYHRPGTLNNAWDSVNEAGGLVQLDETGKIPSYLLPGGGEDDDESIGNVVDIEGFVDDVALTSPGRWYLPNEKRLYYNNPDGVSIKYLGSGNTLYIKQDTRDLYIWKNGGLVRLNPDVMIEEINDLTDILD